MSEREPGEGESRDGDGGVRPVPPGVDEPRTSETVPVADLKDLVDRWGDEYRFHIQSESDRERGMAEGARSAAVELERVIDRHTEADDE